MPEVLLLNDDALKVKADLTIKPTALVTDPPWGVGNNCNYKRFTGGKKPSTTFKQIVGDDQPFDPSPWLDFPQVVLWGYNHFASQLPMGSVLVWNKRRDNQLGKFLSDGELAWWSKGKGVYIFPHVWNGFDRQSERGQKTLHPSQKPVALFKWIFDRLKLKPGDWVFDPFLGSGSSGVAAVEMGLNFVGSEIDESYFNIAKERIETANIDPMT